MVREQRKGLNPIAERLESFRILASDQADSSEEYWGLDYMDEDADPDFDESLEEDELNGGWWLYFLTSKYIKLCWYLINIVIPEK